MSNINNLKFETIAKITKTNFKFKDIKKVSKLDSSSPPSVFIGSKLRYPNVNVGILSPLERDDNAWIYDDMKYWAKNNFTIKDVIKLRNSLLNSRFRSNVKDTRSNKKFLEIAKEIAIASKPVEVELELKNNLRLKRKKDRVLTPHGMRGGLKKAKITSNVKVERKLDKVMNDEIKSSEGINILYKNNFSEYTLSKVLSVGVLGLKKNKKLVPTRWSITATDDTIGKQLLKNIRDYKWIKDYELFFGEFMGNQYVIMLFPNVWSYELFELYQPGSSWNLTGDMKASTDFESYNGRKGYAFATAGGYYATRLPILEYLEKIKRQASAIVIRIESPGYWASLGVWVVRESVRKAIENGVKIFDTREELLNSAKEISIKKYNYDNSGILQMSKLLEQIKTQRNLGEWF